MNIKEIKELLDTHATEEVLSELAKDKRSGVQKLLASYAKAQAALVREQERFEKMLTEEKNFWQAGMSYVAGCDEAGRGPLAGPLVVAAVILPEEVFISGLNDSKQVTAKKRESLYTEIMTKALGITVNIVSPATIDKLNIYEATKEAMVRCLTGFKQEPEVALIDAMPIQIPFVHCKSIIHGDAKSASIAAASIIAKVTRDRIMVELDKQFPVYGFAGHKGYGSEMHMEAIAKYGASIWHRRSYEPIKDMNLKTPLGDAEHTDTFKVLK